MANWVRDFQNANPDRAGWPVYRRARHSLHLRRPDGLIEAHFTGAPQHYEAGDWRALDTTLLLDTARNEYGAPGLRPRLRLDRSNGMGNYGQRTMAVGLFDVSAMRFTSKLSLPDGHLDGDSIVCGGSWWEHRLRLTETGLRETLTILSKPTMAGAKADWLVLDTVVTGRALPDGEVGAEILEGYRFPLPKAHDSSIGPSSAAPCKRWARTTGGKWHIFTGVPLDWLETAQYPVVIDPDYLDSTADGVVYGAGAWAAARSTAYGTSSGDNNVGVGMAFWNPNKYLYRPGFRFDTSTIGADSTITQVNLKLAAQDDQTGTANWDVAIQKYSWSGTDPLTTGNMETFFDGVLAATPDDSIWRNTSGMSLNTQYTSGNLSTAWPSKTGNTYYALISGIDRDNADPGNVHDYITIWAQEAATVGYRPVLTVLYTTPSVAAPRRRLLLGVGR